MNQNQNQHAFCFIDADNMHIRQQDLPRFKTKVKAVPRTGVRFFAVGNIQSERHLAVFRDDGEFTTIRVGNTKEATDQKLACLILETVCNMPRCTVFLLTDDADFTPLVYKLQEMRHVVVLLHTSPAFDTPLAPLLSVDEASLSSWNEIVRNLGEIPYEPNVLAVQRSADRTTYACWDFYSSRKSGSMDLNDSAVSLEKAVHDIGLTNDPLHRTLYGVNNQNIAPGVSGIGTSTDKEKKGM